MPSDEFFHHLTIHEYGLITDSLLAPSFVFGWGAALFAAELSVGRFCMVTDQDSGRNHSLVRGSVPFLN